MSTEPSPVPVPSTEGLNEKLVALLASTSPEVEKRVLDSLVNRVVEQRVDLILKAMARADELRRFITKLNKPDQVVYDIDKKPIQEGFSEGRINELNKAINELKNLEAAVGRALDLTKPDHQQLAKLMGKSDDKGGDK